MAAPGYERRADVAVATLTLQLPLEGKLARGGVVGVVRLADGRWLHAQAGGAQADFYISTREVRARASAGRLPAPACACWTMHSQLRLDYLGRLELVPCRRTSVQAVRDIHVTHCMSDECPSA